MKFDPRDFGGRGIGPSFDDSRAFQEATDRAIAAHGTLAISAPAVYWNLTSTVTIQPPQGSQVYLDVEAEGSFDAITWNGPSNSAVFRSLGWKMPRVRGVKISIPSAAGVVAWDLDVDAVRSSSGMGTFATCYVNFGKAATACTGWRMGHAGGQVGEESFWKWSNSHAFGNDNAGGNIGWVNEHANGVHYTWVGGSGSGLGSLFTNKPSSGASANQGGDSMFFYGVGGSNNRNDFNFATQGSYLVEGGRYEQGGRFIDTGWQNGGSTIVVSGARLAAYTPADGVVFNLRGPDDLELLGVEAYGADYGHAFINADAPPPYFGTIGVQGGAVRGTVDSFYTLKGNWKVKVDRVRRSDALLRPIGFYAAGNA